ncbi:MAG: hypothetical protein ABMA13_12360 [Chthoniobacteraceae bacterium]
MSKPRLATDSTARRRATAARGGSITARVTFAAPAWFRAACEAIVRLADRLAKPPQPAALALPEGARTSPRFERRSTLGKSLAIARRAAVLAAEQVIAAGGGRDRAARLGSAEYFRQIGRPMCPRNLHRWRAIAKLAGGAATCSMDAFLDDRDVPHPRARKPLKPAVATP